MLKLWVTEEVQSLLVPKSKFQEFSVQRLQQKFSYCEFDDNSVCEIQLSRVTAEFQLLQVQYVKLWLSQVTGAHRMMSTCVEIRNRACGFAGYKCSKSTTTYATLLICT